MQAVAQAAPVRNPRRAGAVPWAVVAVLTLAGAVLRLVVANQTLYGDELATYWVVTTHGLADVVSVVHTNAEITPPLYFVLAWFPTQISHAEEYLRAPSLAAGIATIPLIYVLGLRTVGRSAALVATALTTLSPFMIYYSAEARAYAVMMFLVVVSTLAMLRGAETGRVRWWVVYGLSSCLAMYSHYTCAFLLGTQLLWLLWVYPEARKAAILANLGALILFLPWATGVRKDFTSPTNDILSSLSPASLHDLSVYVEHWAFGHPYPDVSLEGMPGVPAMALLGLGVGIAVVGLARRSLRQRRSVDARVLLLVLLALSVPLGTAAASAIGNNIIGVRNIAASWPAYVLVLAVLLAAAGPRLRWIACGFAILAFAIGGLKMVDDDYVRPDHRASAQFVEREIRSGDAVIDETAVISPGPPSTLDTTLRPGLPVFRAGAPAQKHRPFDFGDPIVTIGEAVAQATELPGEGRILLVSTGAPDVIGHEQRRRALRGRISDFGYERVARRTFPGFEPAQVEIFEPRVAGG